MIKFVVVALAAVLQACPPSPQPPDAGPVEDAGTTVGGQVCANLVALGCDEGRATNCAAVVDHAVGKNITRVDSPCLLNAKTKAGVRACGFVTCP